MYSRTARKKEKKRKKEKLHFFPSKCQEGSARACSTGGACAILQVLLVFKSITCIMRGSDEVQCCCMTQIPTAHLKGSKAPIGFGPVAKAKVTDSKWRNAVPLCLIYFTPYILS